MSVDVPLIQRSIQIYFAEEPHCNEPLGLENFNLADSQITASSFRYPDFGIAPVRLNSDLTTGPAAWIAKFANYEQYIQVMHL